ncbi:hypothetical protein B0E33_28785 (plasmid) [Roseibium algicola]|uniref:Uncharacterized protein n=1 Tax=Roseibium algicola TaxID=2857014 RepID=A0ABM6IBB9_9HYPH|nr:hypothetical protein B0E33_28785 [Roseibium aggregatum]
MLTAPGGLFVSSNINPDISNIAFAEAFFPQTKSNLPGNKPSTLALFAGVFLDLGSTSGRSFSL